MAQEQKHNVWILGLGVAVLLAAVFVAWWLKDLQVEVGWDPEWPRSVRVAEEAVEKVEPGPGGEITEGDLARAGERARWKAYYYAQLRAAERLGDLRISSHTTIRDLQEIDQELRASFQGTVRAAAEVESESSIQILEDGAKARVVVEIPAAPLQSFKALIGEAIRAGRISIERRPPPPRVAETPEAEDSSPPPVAEVTTAEAAADLPAADEAEVAAEPVAAADQGTADRGTARRAPRRRAAPAHTGAAVFLGPNANRLGATPVIYDAAGTELGSALDLPPERLTAGFHLASPGDAEAVHRWAGASPRRFEATISRSDLFLTVSLHSEEVLQVRQWLGDGKIVLVLGDPE